MKKTFNVGGMTCASCAQTVEKTAKNLPGMNNSAVNLATEKLTVDFDITVLTEEDIAQAIESAGYELISNDIKKTLNLEGMTCASCAQTIETTVAKL